MAKTSLRRAAGRIAGLVTATALCGCAELDLPEWSGLDGLNPSSTAPSDEPIPVSGAQSADQLDQATAAERAQATSSATGGRPLGRTLATLGSASEAGFWLKTPLVDQEEQGVVRSRDTGKSVAVTLIPIDGPPTAGSRLSLSAMRSLGLPLTALAELDVSRKG